MADKLPPTGLDQRVSSIMSVQEDGALTTEDPQENRAPLACDRCKRRKIKCDRIRPVCRSCLKTSKTCSYPTSSQKPGPKPGVPQRRKARRVNGTESSPYPTPASRKDSHPATSSIGHDGDGSNGSNAVAFTSNYDHRGSLAAPIQSPSTYPRFDDVEAFQRLPPLQQSPHVSISSPGTEKSASRGPALSHLLHLSHEPVPSDEITALDSAQPVGQWRGIGAVCADLEISPDVYPCLLSAYFENMTAISLFHRPTFDAKVSSIPSPIQQRALLASMFAFSARFTDISQNHTTARCNIPSHEHFRKIGEESVDRALRECLDDNPPLCLLQALILTTFQQLTNGVRGRSWRALHTCVSIGYDLHLHLVDKNAHKRMQTESEPCVLEEKRRAWWTLWEFDVFASTIRKLPTAIDWANNETWLPIDDDLWFNNTAARSCTLNPDPAVAWKELERSRNQSPRAWFIVINALMRCAHMVAFPQVYSSSQQFGGEFTSATDSILAAQSNLDVLANSLYCLSAALPDKLSYNGEFLNFSSRGSLQNDSAKHGIHVMTHLCRFMLHHLRVFNSTYQQLGVADSSSSEHLEDPAPTNAMDSIDKAAWNVYLAAASEIVTVVRNSSPKHVRYVNPFLSSTIWLAAAAQIISRNIGPHIVNRRVAESNFDLLQMNLDAYVSFWGVSSILQQKLKVLRARLETVGAPGITSGVPMQESQSQPTASSGMNQAQQFTSPSNGFQYGTTNGMQYPSINPQGSIPSMHPSQGPNLDLWPASQPFNFGDCMNIDLTSNNTWGYGLDELLMYGGFE